jgi:hypothetical protein
MSSGPGFAPADLDRLEDALEDLELPSALGELSPDDGVVLRLAEYREVLLLCREAMPLEDVPGGLLDGVLAQARQAAAETKATAAPTPSFWARWRLGTWVPTLAFAGSAALLLLLLVPRGANEPAAAGGVANRSEAKADAKAADRDGRLALAEPERRDEATMFEGEGAARAGGVAIGERAPEPAAMAPTKEQAGAEDTATGAKHDARHKDVVAPGDDDAGAPKTAAPPSPPKPTPKAPASTGGSSAGGASKGKPSEPADPLGGVLGSDEKDKESKKGSGDDRWSELARADADRRGGSCGLAKMRYDKLRKLDDARVRARALAGVGLCAAASGEASTAKKLFDQARAADPGVGRFIDDELALLDDGRANAEPVQQAAD